MNQTPTAKRIGTAATAAILTISSLSATALTANAAEETPDTNTGTTETTPEQNQDNTEGKQTEWSITFDGTTTYFTSENGKEDATDTLTASATSSKDPGDTVHITGKVNGEVADIALNRTSDEKSQTIVYSCDADQKENTPKIVLTVTVSATTDPDTPVEAPTWSTKVGDQTIQFEEKDGVLVGEADKQTSFPGETYTATPSEGDPEPLTVNKDESTAAGTDSGKLGVMHVEGQQVYEGQTQDGTKFKLTVPYAYDTTGDPVTIKENGTDFTQDENGLYKASATVKLDEKKNPTVETLDLSNGTSSKLADVLGDPTIVPDEDGKQFITRTGVISDKITVTDEQSGASIDQNYEINVTANRAEDKTFKKLTVTETKADGTTETHELDGFAEGKTDYTITLPHSSVNSSFTLSPEYGIDATTDEKVGVALGQGASRILTLTVNDATYKVTVNFQSADIQADSPAKLDGIYVNKTGAAEKGDLIDNWDPNRLDYVVTVGENDPSPYILPVAGDGVTVTPGDLTQTADSMKQEWKVTKDGVTRVYSVTVAREHSWKTAVDEFKPSDPVEQTPSVEPSSDADTDLASHGYVDGTGQYVPVEGDSYQIPEGGKFSYAAKIGQNASVSVAKEQGMTYRYTVTVLPADPFKAPAQHVYEVTYITASTHKAELTGIVVDGQNIQDFSSDKHEYEVSVNDPNQWVLSPQYDKLTGMSVKTVENGADKTVTVTSADGLVSVDYKVHATQKLFGGEGTVGTNGTTNLAQTGMQIGIIAGVVAVLLAVAGAFAVLGRRRRKTSDSSSEAASDTDTTPEAGESASL